MLLNKARNSSCAQRLENIVKRISNSNNSEGTPIDWDRGIRFFIIIAPILDKQAYPGFFLSVWIDEDEMSRCQIERPSGRLPIVVPVQHPHVLNLQIKVNR